MNPASLITITIKATVILAAAFAAAAILRRRSASARHAIWMAAVAAVLALPFLSILLPSWRIERVEQAPTLAFPTTPAAVSSAPADPGPSRSPALPLAALLWAAGAGVVLVRAAAGIARANWITHRAEPLEAPWLTRLASETGVRRRLAVLVSARVSMPLTFGVWRPVILLPPEAATWSAERTRVVLLHELVHVDRLDWLMQIVAQLACALYWFHPLMWVAAARLREERERSCDDRVLA
ncbi:MAG: M56 family metallopeptidase, partial [Bryobacteraceae bacterium]